MKKYMILLLMFLISLIGCKNELKKEKVVATDSDKKEAEQPKGAWKVDKEFDEKGNLIHYDSIYSWSSGNPLDDLTSVEKDSMLNNFESKFYSRFSQFKNEGFGDIFQKDSLFGNYFFNDGFFDSDFGTDFMELDKTHKRMMDRHKNFLEKYRLDFNNKRKDSL